MSDFAIVLRSLRARLFSTIVTSLTVAIAVALLLTLQSIQVAGTSAFLRGSGNAPLLVSADAGPLVSVLNAIFYANPPQRALTKAKVDEVVSSFPWAWAIPMQQGDSYRGFPTLATTPRFLSDFQPVDGEPWQMAEGRAFQGDFELVLGATVAGETGLTIGSSVHLTHGSDAAHGHEHAIYPFTVVGILAPSGSPHDRALLTSLESSWILHAHDRREAAEHHGAETDEDHEHGEEAEKPLTAADLTDEDRMVTGLLLRLPTREGFGVSAAMQSQFDRLRRDPGLTVANPADQIGKLLAIVSRVDFLFVAMAGAILVGSAISILLALYNSMHERRRQVAIFRVLGCTKARVMGFVLTESACIGLVGAVAGILFSLLGSLAAALYLKHEVGLSLGIGVDPRSAIPY